MITVKERIKNTSGSYFRKFFICPACGAEYPLRRYSYFCNGCNKSIVDMFELIEDAEYNIRYHFGFVDEIKTYMGSRYVA